MCDALEVLAHQTTLDKACCVNNRRLRHRINQFLKNIILYKQKRKLTKIFPLYELLRKKNIGRH